MIFIGIAIPAFILAILFGILLLTYVEQGVKTPRLLTHTHGACAIIGLISVILAAFQFPLLWGSAIIFMLAASGGLYLITHDLRGKKVPKKIANYHALLAGLGFVVLILSLFAALHK